eukprot:492773_1
MSTLGLFPVCNNATYIANLHQSHGDYLHKGQILASTNCEYLLRAESNALKLYSTSEHSALYTWYMHDTIWSLSGTSQTESQTLSLFDDGCLTWSSDEAIIKQFCDRNNNALTTTIVSHNGDIVSTASTQEDVSLNHTVMWIPLTICIVATLLGLLFLINLIVKTHHKMITNAEEETVATAPPKPSKPVSKKDSLNVPNTAMDAIRCMSGTDDDCMSTMSGSEMVPDF